MRVTVLLSLVASSLASCSQLNYVHDEQAPTEVDAATSPDIAFADAGDAGNEPGDASSTGDAQQSQDAAADSAQGTCPGPVPTSDPAWKEPPLPRNACTAADLSYLANISGPTATYETTETLLTSRSPACAACIYSHDLDPAWGPIVFVGPASKGRAFVNMGACFARAPGGSMTCGRTMEQLMLCVESVCDPVACGNDEDVRQPCANATAQNPKECGRYDVNTACGGATSYASIVSACRAGFDSIRMLCGGG